MTAARSSPSALGPLLRRWAIRWAITVAVIGVVGVLAFRHLYRKTSDGMRAEMLSLVEDLRLSPEVRSHVRTFMGDCHDASFQRCLDILQTRGRRFDNKCYVNGMFDCTIERARLVGMPQVADDLERERAQVTIGTPQP